MQHSHTVIALLPNGRNLWLEVQPAAVSAADLERLAGAATRSRLAAARRLRALAASTRQLAATERGASARLAAGRARIARQVDARREAAHGRLERRLEREVGRMERRLRIDQRRQHTRVRGHARLELLDCLLVGSAWPLLAAYGQRSDPFATNNLTIALGLGIWLLGDAVADLLAGGPTSASRLPNGWSYGAPFANLLTGWWLLHGLQHERFVSGTVALTGSEHGDGFALVQRHVLAVPGAIEAAGTARIGSDTPTFVTDSEAVEATAEAVVDEDLPRTRIQEDHYRARIDLSLRIAPDSFPDFASYAEVPALATLASVAFADPLLAAPRADVGQVARAAPEIGLEARVHQGVLLVDVRVRVQLWGAESVESPLLTALRVAWAVDTRKPGN